MPRETVAAFLSFLVYLKRNLAVEGRCWAMFGGGSTFGQPQNSGGGFGSTFGGATNSGTTSTFGGGGFGSQATGGFGGTAAGAQGFGGAASPFGSNAGQQQQGNMGGFGQQSQTFSSTSSPFSAQPAQSVGFGSTQNNAFSSSAPTSNVFGGSSNAFGATVSAEKSNEY